MAVSVDRGGDPVSRLPEASGARIRQLDGLRGIAALMVVFAHLADVVPSLAAVTYDPWSGAKSGLAWWLTSTPLHLFWDGTAAVRLFFVLSGFVLTLPMVSAGRPSWSAYYIRRGIRIYLPVWASVLIGLAWIYARPRSISANDSIWLRHHDHGLGVAQVLGDMFLFPAPGAVNGVLWSLKAEVVFSLLLPLYVLCVVRVRRYWLAKLVVVVACITAGVWLNWAPLAMLPMFALGSLIAVEHRRCTAVARRLDERFGPQWWGWLALALAWPLWTSEWVVVACVPANAAGKAACAVACGFQVLAAGLVLVTVAHWRPARLLGERQPFRWLGSRSYSLYLVQEPIVVFVALAVVPKYLGVVPLVVISAVLISAEVFYRLIERPSHLLSRRAVPRRSAAGSAPAAVRQRREGATCVGASDAPRRHEPLING